LALIIYKNHPKFGSFRQNDYLCKQIKKYLPLQHIMETSENSIELLIATVLSDIRQKGYSSVQPFSIGKVLGLAKRTSSSGRADDAVRSNKWCHPCQ
jgi:hypothetical protein